MCWSACSGSVGCSGSRPAQYQEQGERAVSEVVICYRCIPGLFCSRACKRAGSGHGLTVKAKRLQHPSRRVGDRSVSLASLFALRNCCDCPWPTDRLLVPQTLHDGRGTLVSRQTAGHRTDDKARAAQEKASKAIAYYLSFVVAPLLSSVTML